MESKVVNKSFFHSILYVATDIFVAFIIAYFLKYCQCDTIVIGKVSRVMGLLIIGSAVMGRIGWVVQTWSGQSPAEKRNIKLFRLFYFIGIFFTSLSLMI